MPVPFKILEKNLTGMKRRKLKFIKHNFMLLLNLFVILVLVFHFSNKSLFCHLSAKSANYRSCHDGQCQYDFFFDNFHIIQF